MARDHLHGLAAEYPQEGTVKKQQVSIGGKMPYNRRQFCELGGVPAPDA